MITLNLPDTLPYSNPHAIVAVIGGCGFAELMAEETTAIQFHRLNDLPPRTPEEERALAWEPALSDPEPNTTHETRVDDAIKGARDLYEGAVEPWPVAIWRWARGGYGYGFTIPEDTDAILFVDGALMAFEDGRAAR